MSASRLDAVYRSFLITKFFTKGWGKPDNLRRLFEFRKTVSKREDCYKLVETDYPVTITKEETVGECRLLEGHFLTPLERCLPGIVPPAAQQAQFQVLLPLRWPQPGYRPVCLHLAGTGDHYFWRRRNLMAKPLLKEAGIGAIILENPFYGARKPSDQVRSSLHNVSDIFVMGGCLILESLVLFHWCERNQLGPLGVTGLSMGGHMASLAATNWPKPLVLVPCLSWSTASAVFLQGVMAQSINWDLLEDQYLSDGVYREKLSKMVTVVDEAFLAGKKFVRKLSQSMDTVSQDIANGRIRGSRLETLRSVDTNKKSDLEKSENLITKKVVVGATADDAAKKSENLISKIVGVGAPDEGAKAAAEKESEDFRAELTKLSQAGQISESLLVKLSSNSKFELDARDVEELNRLNKEEILARIARNDSMGKITNSKSYSMSSKSTDLAKGSAAKLTQQNVADPTAENFASIEATKLDIATKLGVNTTDLHVNATDYDVSTTKVNVDTIKQAENSTRSNLNPGKGANDSSISNAKPNKLDSSTANAKISKESGRKANVSKAADKKSRNMAEISTDFLTSLPFLSKSAAKKIDISKMHWRDREALQFMRGIMDECTHLSNFSVPFDTSLIIAVCAKHDAYVPREDVGALEEIWPGAEVRYVDAGHVSAYLLHQSMFRSCIIEAFERSKKKWKDGRHVA